MVEIRYSINQLLSKLRSKGEAGLSKNKKIVVNTVDTAQYILDSDIKLKKIKVKLILKKWVFNAEEYFSVEAVTEFGDRFKIFEGLLERHITPKDEISEELNRVINEYTESLK